MANNWSAEEVEAAVRDYFDMLSSELTGRPYNKTEHRRALRQVLDGRSHGSVELKHQNISAVLIEMGKPYICGYKPRHNYQRSLLPEAVSQHLKRHPELLRLFAQDAAFVPPRLAHDDPLPDLLRATPPDRAAVRGGTVSEGKAIYHAVGGNYLEQEAQNQLLGDAGEASVIRFERARLRRLGRDELADRIEHVSLTIGPSAGFDILSFEEDGSERLIEAKTTKYGKETPFFVTPHELEFSREHAPQYVLYRLFCFRTGPRFFELRGRLDKQCTLEPSAYRAIPA